MNVLLKKDDHIIVQYPAYQSLYEIANAIGCKVTKWVMDDENHWELDLQFLETNITQSTKCIVVNFPHNPTGYLPKKDIYEKIINLAKTNNIYLLSDEVYKFLEYNEAERLPSACDLYEKGVSDEKIFTNPPIYQRNSALQHYLLHFQQRKLRGNTCCR